MGKPFNHISSLTNQGIGRVALFGAGGLSYEIYTGFLKDKVQVVHIDDDPAVRKFDDVPVVNPSGEVANLGVELGVVGFSHCTSKKALVNRVNGLIAGFQWPTLIHPSVEVYDPEGVEVCEGVVLSAGCTLTTSIKIGGWVFVNLHCTIGHNVSIGDYCSIMPSVNISGNVILEEGVYIGSGATILPGIRIGANSIIGAGAVVTKDVSPHSLCKGVPAVASPLKKG
jgi:sugar O-acyltransferase (sialic acid O-acetyltransferase NeuD family)